MSQVKIIKEPEGVNIPTGKLRVILEDDREAVVEVCIIEVPEMEGDSSEKKERSLEELQNWIAENGLAPEDPVAYKNAIRGEI